MRHPRKENGPTTHTNQRRSHKRANWKARSTHVAALSIVRKPEELRNRRQLQSSTHQATPKHKANKGAAALSKGLLSAREGQWLENGTVVDCLALPCVVKAISLSTSEFRTVKPKATWPKQGLQRFNFVRSTDHKKQNWLAPIARTQKQVQLPDP